MPKLTNSMDREMDGVEKAATLLIALGPEKSAEIFEHLKEAFSYIQQEAQDGDVVLLSPASASWDQYKQCEDRGSEFKNYVQQIQ